MFVGRWGGEGGVELCVWSVLCVVLPMLRTALIRAALVLQTNWFCVILECIFMLMCN